MGVGRDERARERLQSCERAARVTEGTFLPTVGLWQVGRVTRNNLSPKP